MGKANINQIPLGTLLTQARLEKKLSRAEVAQGAGIAENSLVRYEKAGLEDDGQFPPGPKLAALCFFLEIPPEKAMWSCLDEKSYWQYREVTWADAVCVHPEYVFITDENVELRRRLQLFRAFARHQLRIPLGDEELKSEVSVLLAQKITALLHLENEMYRDLTYRKAALDVTNATWSGPKKADPEQFLLSDIEAESPRHDGTGSLDNPNTGDVGASPSSHPKKESS